ncbi:MAG: methionyl-tRNA formyltransferase [Candidatus Hodarchaeota archaeon]
MLSIKNLKYLSSILFGIEPDIILTMKFSFRLPKSILDIPSIGAINFHPSTLPKYRGPNPIGWQILNNEPFMGLTFHFMSEEYDTGPIILQDKIPISEEDDIRSLTDKLFPGAIIRLLPKVLQLVGDGYLGIEQNHDEATNAPSFSEIQRTIDWTKSTIEIVRTVRSVAFYGAIAKTNNGLYQVFGCYCCSEKLGRQFKIGEEITVTEENNILVRTSDGLLKITEYKKIN